MDSDDSNEERDPNGERFQKARERLGWELKEAAERLGISVPCLWDIEGCDDELTGSYSVGEIRRFCEVLQITPLALFGIDEQLPPLSAAELSGLIQQHCERQQITIEQFEDAAGWRVAESLKTPERFLHDFPMDGIRHICEELGVDWRRFLITDH